MAKTHSLCIVDGCDNGGKLRVGLCSRHYKRAWRHGDTSAARRYPERGDPAKYLADHMWDDCPKWPFARGRGGYGRIQHEGGVRDVHRLVCETVHGPSPSPDHVAAHDCGKGNEGCFGARCIRWKTRSENQRDRIRHGTAGCVAIKR
jgi:hypothetical protein